jgi:opacity protein-like surface antigen
MPSGRLLAFFLLASLGFGAAETWAGEAGNRQAHETPSSAASSSGLSVEGWGVRLGFTSGNDQVIAGAHVNLGEIARNWRFQPDLELGAGDNTTSLLGTAPLYYRFHVASRMTPYAGGGVVLGYFDRDSNSPNGGGSEFGIGARATGGLEWDRKDGNFFVELSLGFGDAHDVQFVAAWTF